jgi:hypothetical protein
VAHAASARREHHHRPLRRQLCHLIHRFVIAGNREVLEVSGSSCNSLTKLR